MYRAARWLGFGALARFWVRAYGDSQHKNKYKRTRHKNQIAFRTMALAINSYVQFRPTLIPDACLSSALLHLLLSIRYHVYWQACSNSPLPNNTINTIGARQYSTIMVFVILADFNSLDLSLVTSNWSRRDL